VIQEGNYWLFLRRISLEMDRIIFSFELHKNSKYFPYGKAEEANKMHAQKETLL